MSRADVPREAQQGIGLNRRDTIAGALGVAALATQPVEASTRASSWSRAKRKLRILGAEMAYQESGDGPPIIFLHGNPTSSYLWRNIIPHVEHLGRCIAPDLIGMGDSAKLPGTGPDRYSFEVHQHYLYALLDALKLHEPVTLVLHDWGSALGLSWARQNENRVRGIAYMEAILEPPGSPTPAPPPGTFFAKLRSSEGERFVLEENGFIERLVDGLNLYITAEDAAEYRRPFRTPGDDRWPTLDWPRELPLGAEPADMYALVRSYSDWFVGEASMPKLLIRADPGALMSRKEVVDFIRTAKNQSEVLVYGPHFVQEVSPHAIGRALGAWIPTL
jgi:haloalkane dehalogenase